MDDRPHPSRPAPRATFRPRRPVSLGTAALGVIAGAAAAAASEPTGRLLFALTAVVLLGYAFGDLLWTPRLAVDAGGLSVRSPWSGLGPLRLRWDEVDTVRVDVRHRHGLRTAALEIEAGERLVVLTRRALGTDPERAAELIAAFGPGAG